MPKELYDKFLEMWKPIALLIHTVEMLDWDQLTYMPKGESETRAEQMAMFAEMIHQKTVDNRLFDILCVLELRDFKGDYDLDIEERANVREAMRAIKLAKALPNDLVAALAKETSLASDIWQEARHKNSFNDFAPALAKIISLSREKAEADVIFDKLRAELPPLVKTIMSLKPPDDSFLIKCYPKNLQAKISREIIAAMGLDWNRCRLDV